jgi:sodium-dependent dicarboxylate transporter 2/3/5
LNGEAAEGVRLPPARVAILALGGIAAAASILLGWGPAARAAIIATTCVALWLGELVPVWVPTVLLWVATPLLLASAGDAYAPARVLGWSVDPVLALFLAGFALAAAASAQGVDRAVAALALRLSRGRPVRLVVLIALATAVLSMWMSNVAAAALMLAALRPVLDGDRSSTGTLRRPLLLAVALAADVGGIATPVGTGPNGMAMAALERTHPINFVQWMLFGVPLAFGLIAAALALVLWRVRPTGEAALPDTALPDTAVPGPTARSWRLGIVFAATILLWLTEPLHGVRAWIIALGAVAALVATGLLGWRDARRMDWSTLLLIAGGIALGALLEQSGLVRSAAAYLPLASAPPVVRLLALCVVSASLSAVMSNTATAAFLIPLAATLDPAPSTVILVAISASLGIPFVISTPPNAMAVGTGLLRSRELLVPGLVIMLGGCVLVALTGPSVLRMFGVP